MSDKFPCVKPELEPEPEPEPEPESPKERQKPNLVIAAGDENGHLLEAARKEFDPNISPEEFEELLEELELWGEEDDGEEQGGLEFVDFLNFSY